MQVLPRFRKALVAHGWACTAALFSLSCARPADAPSSAPVAPTRAVLPRVRIVSEPDRPTLQLVHRLGDPVAAVAVAIHVEGGGASSLALQALLGARLEKRLGAHLIPSQFGLVVSARTAQTSQAARLIRAVHGALRAPVTEREIGLVAARLRELGPAKPEPVDACLGLAGATPRPQALSRADLERARTQAFVSGRIGISAVGPEQFLQAVLDSAEPLEFPSGAPVAQLDPAEDRMLSAEGMETELRLALHTPRAAQAVLVARALAQEEHPLHARLRSLPGHFQATDPVVALRPSGACLAFRLRPPAGLRSPRTEIWTMAAEATRREVIQALELADPASELAATLLAPEDSEEAAVVAASVAPPSVYATGEHWIFEYVAPAGSAPAQATLLNSHHQSALHFAQPRVSVARREETGQPASWLLLASPCGTRGESAEEAGFRALAIGALAESWGDREGISLVPWISPEGLGLVGRASRRHGESWAHHASRLARGVARALLGEQVDGRAVAAVRDAWIGQLGEDPGYRLALEVLGGGFPSRLEPRGLAVSLSRASAADVERVRFELAAEPLRAALLDASDGDVSPTVASALSEWFAGSEAGPVPCEETKPVFPRPGLWTLTTLGTGEPSRLFLSVPLATERELGRGLAHLFNRPSGWLDRALLQPALAASARVQYLGGPSGGGFLFEIRSTEDGLVAAEAQVRGLLDRLAKDGLAPSDALAAEAERVARERRDASAPTSRIVQAFLGRDPGHFSGVQAARVLAQLRASEHRVVRVVSRR